MLACVSFRMYVFYLFSNATYLVKLTLTVFGRFELLVIIHMYVCIYVVGEFEYIYAQTFVWAHLFITELYLCEY